MRLLFAGDDEEGVVWDVDDPAAWADDVGLLEEEGDDDEAWFVGGCESLLDAESPVGRPCAANALTTASHPRSSVLIRSLSSSFSRSLSCSRLMRSSSSGERMGMPAAADAATLASDASDGRLTAENC